MKYNLSFLQKKSQSFLFLRVYLILAPIVFLIYFAVNAGLKSESFAEYLASQAINPIMLLIALLSFFWFVVLHMAQNQTSKKIWKQTLIVFIASNVLTGNLAAIILGYITLKQDIALGPGNEAAIPNASLVLLVINVFLLLISGFVCFALIRITII